MSNRHGDWFRQAEADLRHARNSVEAGDYEWACFAAQQAAGKAAKAVVQGLGGEPWGRSVTVLLGGLAERTDVPVELIEAGKRLDKHYIPTPASDVDLCVVVESDDRRPRDRIPDYLPDRFPAGVDLLVLTEAELENLAARAPTWHRAIVSGRAV